MNYYENIRFIILICEFIFFLIFVPTFVIYLYKSYKKEINLKETLLNNLFNYKVFSIFIITISIISVVDILLSVFCSNTNIGSFYEKEDYTEDFYIFISKEPFDKSTSIRRVPATIHSVRGGLENNSYYIKSIEINGNKIYINSQEEIYLNFDTKISDYEDNIYYVQLTKNKVN